MILNLNPTKCQQVVCGLNNRVIFNTLDYSICTIFIFLMRFCNYCFNPFTLIFNVLIGTFYQFYYYHDDQVFTFEMGHRSAQMTCTSKVIVALNIFQLIMGCLVKHAQTQHKSVTFRPIVNKVRLLQCFLYTTMSDCISFEYNYITPIDII